MQIAQNNLERFLIFSASKRLESGAILGKQLGIGSNKAKFPRTTDRLESGSILAKQLGVQSNEAKSLRISERLKRTEIRNLGYDGSTKYSSTSTLDDTWDGNSPMWHQAKVKRMNSTDESGMDDHFHFTKKSPPFFYRRLVPQSILTEKTSQAFPPISEDKAHETMQEREPSSPVNIDLITEEVMRQIDRRLLTWRERTGKV